MKKRLALALAATLTIGLFAGCAAQNDQGGDNQGQGTTDGQYTDGTYEGTGQGYKGDIKLSVKVEGGKITSIDVIEQQETQGLGDAAIETGSERIIETQSTDVEAVSGATGSSNGTMEAVKNALEGK